MQKVAAPNGTPVPPKHEGKKIEDAKRRVAALRNFYAHFIVFVVVNLGLIALNIATVYDRWVQWALLGWCIGVLAHALTVFARASKLLAEWEGRKSGNFSMKNRTPG